MRAANNFASGSMGYGMSSTVNRADPPPCRSTDEFATSINIGARVQFTRDLPEAIGGTAVHQRVGMNECAVASKPKAESGSYRFFSVIYG